MREHLYQFNTNRTNNHAKNRIGEKRKNNAGFLMEIIAYNLSHDITIKFETGDIVEHITYSSFKRGSVQHPKIGIKKEKYDQLKNDGIINNYGWRAFLEEYHNYNDITIRFEYDGYIKEKCDMDLFTRGKQSHPKHRKVPFDIYTKYINQSYKNSHGTEYKIIEITGMNNITVEFTDWKIKDGILLDKAINGKVSYPGRREQNRDKQYRDILNSCINHVYNAYKYGAKHRNISFNLTQDDFKEIIFKPCYYCGDEPRIEYKMKYKNQSIKHSGVDRINPNLGYIKSNIVPCCTMCNISKNDHTLDEWMEWIRRLTLYQRESYQ